RSTTCTRWSRASRVAMPPRPPTARSDPREPGSTVSAPPRDEPAPPARLVLLPRLLRFRDAPRHLGMDRNRFNAEVRPHVTAIPIGSQGIAFDRLELDAWVEQHKRRNGRPAQPKGELIWDASACRDSSAKARSGTSTSASEAADFAKALASATSARRRST